MPRYTFVKEDGYEETHWLSISELDKFLEKNPNLTQKISALNIADPARLGRAKPSDGFREVLRNVQAKNHGAKINTW